MDNDHDSQISCHGCNGLFCVTEADSQVAKGTTI